MNYHKIKYILYYKIPDYSNFDLEMIRDMNYLSAQEAAVAAAQRVAQGQAATSAAHAEECGEQIPHRYLEASDTDLRELMRQLAESDTRRSTREGRGGHAVGMMIHNPSRPWVVLL